MNYIKQVASIFNELVTMHINFFNGKMILHCIDYLSRYSAALTINSKIPEEYLNKIFQFWKSVFRPPSIFFSDKGGEFNEEQFKEMCEKRSITVKTLEAEGFGAMSW